VYSTKVDGEVFEFGTSGMLYRSNKLMYDRATKSLWHQFTGEPVVGVLANSGIKLEVLPIVLTTWGDWLAAHPDTTVLDNDTGLYPADLYLPESNPRSIYYGVRHQPMTSFPVWLKSDRLPEKSEVFGLTFSSEARAYPLEILKEHQVVNDTLGKLEVVIVTVSEIGDARAYQRGGRIFEISRLPQTNELGSTAAVGAILFDSDGNQWRALEDALVRMDDPTQSLPRIGSQTAYWFGWYSFYPSTTVYGQE